MVFDALGPRRGEFPSRTHRTRRWKATHPVRAAYGRMAAQLSGDFRRTGRAERVYDENCGHRHRPAQRRTVACGTAAGFAVRVARSAGSPNDARAPVDGSPVGGRRPGRAVARHPHVPAIPGGRNDGSPVMWGVSPAGLESAASGLGRPWSTPPQSQEFWSWRKSRNRPDTRLATERTLAAACPTSTCAQ